MFFCEYLKIYKNTYFTEHLQMAASEEENSFQVLLVLFFYIIAKWLYQNFLYASYFIVLYSIDKTNNKKNKSGDHTTTQQTGKATRQLAQILVVGRKICGRKFSDTSALTMGRGVGFR